MNYAVILASGVGSRYKSNIPKQFVEYNGKPLLVYTVEKFIDVITIDEIIVVVSEEYHEFTSLLMKRYFDKDIKVIIGSNTRMNSFICSLSYIEKNNIITEEDIIVTHDGVRFNTASSTIEDCICKTALCGATTLTIKATDTIVLSKDGNTIDKTMNRSELYQVQTPQTFLIKDLIQLIKGINRNELNQYTDIASMYVEHGKKVHMIEGNVMNIKVTYNSDSNEVLRILKKGNI